MTELEELNDPKKLDNLMETAINLSDLNTKRAVIREALKLFIFTKKM